MRHELSKLKSLINKSTQLLSNSGFINNVSIDKVELERSKLADFSKLLSSTIEDIQCECDSLFGDFASYFIEEVRFSKYVGELFTDEYFRVINSDDIRIEEKEELLKLYHKDKLLEIFESNSNRYL